MEFDCLTTQKEPRMNSDKYGAVEMTWQYVDMRANGEKIKLKTHILERQFLQRPLCWRSCRKYSHR